MSALPPIADVRQGVVGCLLLTQSGHWDIALLQLGISAMGNFEGRRPHRAGGENLGGAVNSMSEIMRAGEHWPRDL